MSAVLRDPGPALPMAAMRPPTRGRPMSPDRRNIEETLRTAGVALSAPELAARCGLDVYTARKLINKMCDRGHAHNTCPGQPPALYAFGPPPNAATAPVAVPVKAGDYDGAELRPYNGRPGAMDAYALPSLRNGQRMARTRPMLIGPSTEPRS
jgi:hypothetical protein